MQREVLTGAPLTLLEANFNMDSGCRACGNTGIGLTGRFCKCPHGRKSPPAQLHEGFVLTDVGPLAIGTNGKAVAPRQKLGIRGPYVYEGCGVRHVADPSWANKYRTYAAMGHTLAGILGIVETKAHCSAVSGLTTAMPHIEAAVEWAFGVDLDAESRQSATAVYSDDHLRADGVVYTYSSSPEADDFMARLDTAGYDGVVCESDELQASEIKMRAFLSHNRQTVRVIVYQASAGVGFDGVIKLKRQVPV
jgi:hypothetical protein